jgi:hypothetical protein
MISGKPNGFTTQQRNDLFEFKYGFGGDVGNIAIREYKGIINKQLMQARENIFSYQRLRL